MIEEPVFTTVAEVRAWLAGFILRELDPRRILSVTAAVIGRFLGASRVCFGEINIAAERSYFILDWTDGVPSIEGPQPFYPESAFGRLYAQGRPIAIDDYSRVDLVRNEGELLEQSNDLSFIAVPLLWQGEVVAVFAASDHRPRRWSTDDIDLMGEIGPMIWRAYEHLLALERLAEAQARAGDPLRSSDAERRAMTIDHFALDTPRGPLTLPVDRIEWIEAMRDYAVLHTMSGNHVVRRTMAELEAGLDPHGLMRVHRSAFISPPAVRGVKRQGRRIALILRSGAVVPVSAAYDRTVRERFGALVAGRLNRPDQARGTMPARQRIRAQHVTRDWKQSDDTMQDGASNLPD